MEPIRIANVLRPTAAIARALRKAYPREGVMAVGIGQRRSNGELTGETAIKVLLANKVPRTRSTAGRARQWLPKSLVIEAPILGRHVRFAPRIDIEQVPRAVSTWFSIGVANGMQVPSAYASWFKRNGHRGVGFVTAGHGLWRNGEPIARTTVEFPSGLIECAVKAVSHLVRDQVDVALLEIPPSKLDEVELPSMPRPWRGAKALSNVELVALLGIADDLLALDVEFDAGSVFADFRSIAFYGEYVVDIEGWGRAKLLDAVESHGPVGTFIAGTSGAAIGETTDPRRAVGIQSLCLDPDDSARRRSLATSFARADEWLRSKVGPRLLLTWDPAQLGL